MSYHLGILPSDVIDRLTERPDSESVRSDPLDTRLVRLPHPRTGVASLFLVSHSQHPETKEDEASILEVQAVAPPHARSWFHEENVVADGKLLVMTPIDPAFLLIPILQASIPDNDAQVNFMPLDDILESSATRLASSSVSNESISRRDVISLGALPCVKRAVKRICEAKEITEEIIVYRYSSERVLEYLRKKVYRLSKPPHCDISRTIVRSLAKDGLMDDGKEELLRLGRTKAACEILSQYLSPEIYQQVLSSYDFSSLDTYLKTLNDNHLVPVESGNSTAKAKKGSRDNVAGATQSDGAKKRKAPAKGSHGVEKLKKANTNGMSKLSTFFQKKSA
ncbi:hypothetical protein CONPUDRAFT_136310 [Coniophora puteana RWD-64-598 SS2]|uniref:Ribonuclease H2 subunit B n=1 Tax=Coniophora puteana (strain RWD-64-598) TaxID=741705 RepID=A0A5M3MVJ0_CONPW|nr:uncharacterized protein CONPUDRAFT_136310 [Coniophora puteana RWD-64-598 SS2]EIW83182.1 hypothetical protein CONPUDRAFT_136310 [Coniophora puteana RWD-64-598 SS2]